MSFGPFRGNIIPATGFYVPSPREVGIKTTRRSFVRHVGIALASLMGVQCRLVTSCYVPEVVITPSPSSPPTAHGEWATLRECWLDLDNPELQSHEDTDYARELRQRHSGALDALVSSGDLDSLVANEIAAAFEEAIAHIQRQMATCYVGLPPEFGPREDLMQQAALLEELASDGDIDPDTVSEVQVALERDIAWLARFHAGELPGEWGDVKVEPESAEAARILVQLLLGDQGFE